MPIREQQKTSIKLFLAMLGVIIIAALVSIYATGCSTYGHFDGTEVESQGGPREGSGKCDPLTECCNPSSCNPACADGFVCMSGRCINVLQVCASASK